MEGICKVLIIDDCEEDREVYQRYLQKSQSLDWVQFEIDAAESAEDALERCETQSFDVILLDYDLPELTGIEFLGWSQTQNLSDVAIIMLSAFGDESLAVRALKQGAQDYLVKDTLTAEILFHSIRTSLEQVRLRRQLQQSQERQQLISNLALRIRNSLDVSQVLETSVVEIRKLLKCDRVLLFQELGSFPSPIVAESVGPGHQAATSLSGTVPLLLTSAISREFGRLTRELEGFAAIEDLARAGYPLSEIEGLQALGVLSLLQVPIWLERSEVETPKLWGYVVLHQCRDRRVWSRVEQEMLQELSVHLAIAIQQSELLTQTQCALIKEKELNQFKSKIVATVSHEYRTPITSILASSVTLERYQDKLDADQTQRLLNMISQQARHLRELVDGMLIVNQVELGQLQFKPFPLNLEQFFRRLIDEYEVTMLDSHELLLKLGGDIETFLGDFGLLKLIFGNLLSNAIKYSPDGGEIILAIEGTETDVTVRIRDRGIGIPSQDLPQLFQSFSRASNVDTITGTGLGLSIAKACVDLHQGQITIQSMMNQFTEVRVVFPKQPL